MKLIADRILAAKLSRSSPLECRELAEARASLVLPSDNHLPVNIQDENIGFCDRFVFGDIFEIPEIPKDSSAHALTILGNLAVPRLPLPLCWLEFCSLEMSVGCLGRRREDGNDELLFFVYELGRPFYLGKRLLTSIISDDISHLGVQQREGDGTKWLREFIDYSNEVIVWWLAYMQLPRFIATERVRRPLSAAERVFARNRLREGRPQFSYNVVKTIIPETCEYRGEIVATESLRGLRGHMVVGHWRLIDGEISPYWVWVDGFKRGNEDLGFVTKERHVHVAQESRRGFLVPQHSGQTRERVAASREAS